MATITKHLNGVDIDRPDLGWILDSVSTFRPGLSSRRAPLELPRIHGSRTTGQAPVYAEPTVQLEWVIVGATQADLEGAWASLAALLNEPGLIYGHGVDGVLQEAPADLVSISEPNDFLVGEHVTMTALLALPGVFLRDVDYKQTNLLTPGTHNLSNWNCSAPITDPIIRFTGPVNVDGTAQLEVYDTAYGEGVKWLGPALTSSQYLYLDPGNFRAWISTSSLAWDQPNGSTNVVRYLSYPAAGRLQLHPRITVPALGTNSPISHEVRVRTTSGPCVIRARGAWF